MHKPFHQLIGALAERTGLTDLKAAADDVLTVLFDGLPLTMQYLPEDDAVLFFSALGSLPHSNREDFCLKLLEANHFFSGTGGATLSAHRASGVVGLHMVAPMEALDEARFMRTIESYMNTAEHWARACTQAEEARPASEQGPAQEQGHPSGSGWVPV